MNSFFLITNHDKDIDDKMTDRIESIIKKCGKKCHVYDKNAKIENGKFTDPDQVPDDTDCVIVLGGDGTLLLAARDLVGLDIPMIGVNFGNLGYLAEAEKPDIEAIINRLVTDDCYIESRIMLVGGLYRDGKLIEKNIALNDIVVGRSGNLRVNDFKIYVDDKLLNQYTADGIIISTPTGSTAYNLSAGGPIVEPTANIIVITPVCPHTLNTRSIVLSAESRIEVEICRDRHGVDDEKMVSFDGSKNLRLKSNDRIVIEKSDLDTKIVKISKKSFVEILQKKMSVK